MLLQSKTSKVCGRTEGRRSGYRTFIFLSGKLLYFFLGLCDYSDKFPKMFCSSCGGKCLSTTNFCHHCGQQLNWVRSRIRRHVWLKRKKWSIYIHTYLHLHLHTFTRSIYIGDILTQPSLVCWKNVMEYECTWGCERKLKNRLRKLRPVRRCFLSIYTLITCRSFIILNFIEARKASQLQIQVRKLCKI